RDPMGLRRAPRRPHNVDSLALKDLVERPGKLLIAMSNQKPEGLRTIGKCPRELPCLLRHPCGRRRRRATGEVHPATPEFNEEEDVQSLQPDGLHGEEIPGEQMLMVRPHKLAPRHPASGADGANTCLAEPRAYRVVAETQTPRPFSSPTMRR